MNRRELNFAIVGCGRIAQRHAMCINRIGKLSAVCDVDFSKARSLATEYGAQPYSDLNKMLQSHSEIDVMAICTPNGLHAGHSITALEAGCHVLCEKPMAIRSADCLSMIRAAEKAQRNLLIVMQNRFNPPVVAVKKLLDENRLGKIYSIQINCFWNRDASYYKDTWRGTNNMDGGTLFTQFSHFIDLLYWMFGDIKQTHALLRNFHHRGIIEFEDTGAVLLEFENGIIGNLNFTVNSYERNMEGSLTIFGEKGTVKIGGEYLNRLEYQQIDGYKMENLPRGNDANNYDHYVGSMSNHGLVYKNLWDVLLHHGTIATSGFEGMKTVEIIEMIYHCQKQV